MYSIVFSTLFLGIYLVGGMEHSLSALEPISPSNPTLQARKTTEASINHSGTGEISRPAHSQPKLVKQNSGLEWSSWSGWSSCSRSSMTGFRVRNRVCPEDATCFGDDVQLIKCRNPVVHFGDANYEASEKYINKCKKLGKRMNLSCKLYLENPDLAYDIFRKHSCFFTVDPDEDDFSLDNQTPNLPTSGDEEMRSTRDERPGETLSVNSDTNSSFRSENVLRSSEEARKRSSQEVDEYTFRVIHALMQERKCKANCHRNIYHASRLWALSTGSSQSAKTTINILSRNKKLANGVGNMFFEYNACVKKCDTIGKIHASLGRKSRESSDGIRPNEVKRVQTPPSSGNTESLCAEKTLGCALMLKTGANRKKRHASSNRYVSPCFSSESVVPEWQIHRRVRDENSERVQAQLYHYQSHVQRFIRRKCSGTRKADNTELFVPKEQVTQQNGRPAFCKQGFLTRHALFIVENPSGEFQFEDGQRFSIESRSFEVESHCEIVVSK